MWMICFLIYKEKIIITEWSLRNSSIEWDHVNCSKLNNINNRRGVCLI